MNFSASCPKRSHDARPHVATSAVVVGVGRAFAIAPTKFTFPHEAAYIIDAMSSTELVAV